MTSAALQSGAMGKPPVKEHSKSRLETLLTPRTGAIPAKETRRNRKEN
jgi:hypothetical protein